MENSPQRSLFCGLIALRDMCYADVPWFWGELTHNKDGTITVSQKYLDAKHKADERYAKKKKEYFEQKQWEE